jgi:flagellin-like hook-associated protein FlgL
MISIGTNASALMAQAATASAQIDAETAMQRLSSGKRINAAKDDAAGVAIASRMTSHVKGLHQSIRNSMDAQALISTAEGGLQETEVLLQRIRELAVQASNDTNSDADRTNLNNEAQQLLEGIDAIASGTTWAGQNLLDGTYSNKSFQVGGGSMAADQLTTSLQSSTAIELGLGYVAAIAEVSQVGGEVQAVTLADGTETTVVGTNIRLQGNDTGGFAINGIDLNDESGRFVSDAGDVNGDGLDDLIMGARYASPNGKMNAGESHVVFGKTDGTAVELSDVTAGTGGFVINGIDAGDYSGYSVSNAGDVNGDGLDDLIVGMGTSYARLDGIFPAGESYVVFGKTDGTAVELSDVAAGTGGFVINGIESGDNSGRSVSNAGDVNGDGLDDLIIGSYFADQNGVFDAGESHVVFGKTDGTAVELSDVTAGTGGFVINGIDAHDVSGSSVSNAGDVNGDGLDDLIVGAHGADPNGNSKAGESYVVFGKTDGTAVELSDVTAGTGGFVINGIDADDYSGYFSAVSNAGDVNGDGLEDLIVGAHLADPSNAYYSNSSAGESYVVFGKTDGTAVELSDVTAGTGGFVINGIDAYDKSGSSVSNAGDVNGDGLDDVIVGAPSADPNGNSAAGESYVVFGKTDTDAVELSNIASGTGGFVINGIDESDASGYSVSNAGDVNGDGLDDLIVGAKDADPNGAPGAGESYVVFGKTDTDAVELSEVSQNPPALSSNAAIVVHGKTIAIDLSSYYDGSTNDYYGAAAAVAAVINNDTDLQALDYSAIAATSTQVAAGTHLAGDVIVSRADTPITTVATNEVPEVPAISLTNHSNAQNALTRLDTALQTINSQRAELGSLSNRLDHIIANNTNASTNTKASLGRIQDADFAAETTKLAKSKILEQSSTAMLAQANASVYEVLTLIPD